MSLKVDKINLLAIAALVWTVAGVNILRIGLESYAVGHLSVLNVVLSVVVGSVFWFFVFSRLTAKHTKRIVGSDERRQYFWKFFDLRSFVIMAVMMTGGILIRTLSLAPTVFIAVFYTGLGTALTLAGLLFCRNRIRYAGTC